jgi:hypothetical protein
MTPHHRFPSQKRHYLDSDKMQKKLIDFLLPLYLLHGRNPIADGSISLLSTGSAAAIPVVLHCHERG